MTSLEIDEDIVESHRTYTLRRLFGIITAVAIYLGFLRINRRPWAQEWIGNMLFVVIPIAGGFVAIRLIQAKRAFQEGLKEGRDRRDTMSPHDTDINAN